ncbi:anthranilate synthase component I [Halotia branconii]|uniref:Anthranilate synthase component 1 n=1 Tax=Halotia branconii CENA392 TaxID=1539056 RepID=A0AAJ6NNK1_9CYAN|nr:anthranilate synthase component I [Halotia branconii]WGV23765.1 anthranilate synthase component I [Halotia branconii CENA392]
MTKPWYWRSLPLKNRTGSEVFAALFRSNNVSEIATLLESPYPTPTNQPQLSRYSICAGAPRIINKIPQMWTPPLGTVLPFLENLLQTRNSSSAPLPLCSPAPLPPCPRSLSVVEVLPPHLPFTGGWLGWLGYDVAWEIEQLPDKKSDNLPFPVAFWYEPDAFAILDHAQQILWLAASEIDDIHHLETRLTRKYDDNSSNPLTFAPEFLTSQPDYEAAVNRAKKYIQAGEIFQANLSLRFTTTTSASGWSIYQALQKINPSPFASYWQTPWGEVMSCSPERLVLLQNRQAQTRPIAGTRSRGATPEQDNQLAQELLSNTKERAEHIMLVDLERNDLGRVCEYGTVNVDELLTIERYSHVMHLVSNIQGTLKCKCTATNLIRALFPGGTITGCPKVRCMEIIEELEPMRRSLFYGSCGYLDWRGNLDLNILIRTLLLTPSSTHSPLNTVWGQVGAGIVADSNPQREWDESLHKAQAQLAALKMFNP